MNLIVAQPTRIRIALYGPERLFGDAQQRRALRSSPEGCAELEQRFLTAWNAGLEAAVRTADLCSSAWARERINQYQKKFLDDSQEHRHFRYLRMDFVAQLARRPDGNHEVTQLWKIRSAEDDATVLVLRFAGVEEKEALQRIAKQLGYRTQELGLELVRDFMRKWDRGREQSSPSGCHRRRTRAPTGDQGASLYEKASLPGPC